MGEEKRRQKRERYRYSGNALLYRYVKLDGERRGENKEIEIERWR